MPGRRRGGGRLLATLGSWLAERLLVDAAGAALLGGVIAGPPR
ncbi:MAG TPA: hypothetical protein VKQ71_03445 [Acidimicrobiales bacterium]|nr:hypothetical protein [Acidimicrobiales bacterium]